MPTTLQAAAAAAVAFLVYAAGVATAQPNKAVLATITDVAFPAMSLVNVPLAALAASKANGRLRAAWAALTVGLAAWAMGELTLAYYERVVGVLPFPSWADVGYLSLIPFVALALLLFPSAQTWRDQSRLFLDGLIVTGSLFLISWVTVMRRIWEAEGGSRWHFALQMAYPAGDVLIVALGFLVLFRAPEGLRTTLGLLVAGLACSAAGNVVWAYRGDPTNYKNGGVADIFYAANFLLIGVALVSAGYAKPGAVVASESPGRLSLWLPLVPVAVAAVFVASARQDVVMTAPVVGTGAVLIVATLFRQFVESAELVRREHQIRHLADRLTAELDSASHYVASILPGELDGPVQVSSRYLPARAVGGDSFGYEWIDDDHLIVYLVDVSGHGVKPALLSVSVHNMLRSWGPGTDTLLVPDRVLTELNERFAMEDHDGHYFTMWFGVYRRSTGVLRYANAGHPPPLILTGQGDTATCVPLPGVCMPIGMFGDAEFSSESCDVASGSEVLVYSDGVLGDELLIEEFEAACTALASGTSSWLDALIDGLGVSDDDPDRDDCSLVLLRFS